MVDDPGDLFRVEARVDRVQHGTDAHGTIPGGHVTLGVPAEGGNTVAKADALILQRRGNLFRHVEQVSIGDPFDVAFHAAGDDFAGRVDPFGMLQNLVRGKLPVLHQAFHAVSSSSAALASLSCNRSVCIRAGDARQGIEGRTMKDLHFRDIYCSCGLWSAPGGRPGCPRGCSKHYPLRPAPSGIF